MGANWGTGMPMPVTPELMRRGRAAFQHHLRRVSRPPAAGNGITKSTAWTTVVTLQDERIRKMADGEIFNTITNGKNTMMAYGP